MKKRKKTVERLQKALKFYADPRRYEATGQKPIKDDTYSPEDFPSVWDVWRDCGDIARAALEDIDKIEKRD